MNGRGGYQWEPALEEGGSRSSPSYTGGSYKLIHPNNNNPCPRLPRHALPTPAVRQQIPQNDEAEVGGKMTCARRMFSHAARAKSGQIARAALASCRRFHAELVRQESSGLPIIHHSKYVCDLPAKHRFPMGKFPKVLQHLLQDQVITEKQ
ncbi:unnamed protein product [Menidia menidia]|nr:unnamed protein product [Menidia menidia]